MKIVYREHAKLRINVRNIRKVVIETILREKNEEYVDTETNYVEI